MKKAFGIISFAAASCLQLEQAPAMDFIKEGLHISQGNSASQHDKELAFEAVEEGNIHTLEKLIKKNKKDADFLISRNYRGRTLLHIAALRGFSAIVNLLIQANPALLKEDLARDDDKNTALHLAVIGGNLEVIKILIKSSPAFLQENLLFSYEFTPLDYAITGGDLQIIETLVWANPGLLHIKNGFSNTALHTAVNYGHLSIVERLIQLNPALLQENLVRGFGGLTPLDLAVSRNYSTIVEKLIQANPKLTNMSTLSHEAQRKCLKKK